MITPYYEQDGITIYNADCRDVIPALEIVGAVVTDPPYKDEDIGEEYYSWFKSWVDILRFRDYFVFFNNASRLYDLLQIMGKPYRTLIWSKGIVKYAWRFEPILCYAGVEPTYKANKYITSDHLPYQPLHNGQAVHQYEKPEKLMSALIRYFRKSDTILDPFMGSGTTLVSAKKHGLKAIGIEINPEHCETAITRLSQLVMPMEIREEAML